MQEYVLFCHHIFNFQYKCTSFYLILLQYENGAKQIRNWQQILNYPISTILWTNYFRILFRNPGPEFKSSETEAIESFDIIQSPIQGLGFYASSYIYMQALHYDFCTKENWNANIGLNPSQWSPLSGHSQQRPPSLMWPQFFAAATINVFTSLSHQSPPL